MSAATDMERLLSAMQATEIPAPAQLGLWYVHRRTPPEALLTRAGYAEFPGLDLEMTSLMCWTEETLHEADGETVMSDHPGELLRHIPAVLAAHGRVLVTGLGLGCVVRGLLANERVEHVDVVEISTAVVGLVWAHMPDDPRLSLHVGDALEIPWPPGTRWDLAWHDVWRPGNQGLHEAHLRLLMRYRPMVERQGAWALPRWLKRRVPAVTIG